MATEEKKPLLQARFESELERQRRMQDEVWGRIGIPPEEREKIQSCVRRIAVAGIASATILGFVSLRIGKSSSSSVSTLDMQSSLLHFCIL